MHIFLDKFHQGEKYTAHIAIQQAEMRREGRFIDQKSLSITSLQTEFLNIDSSSVSGKKNKGANIVKTKSTFCGGSNHSEKKQKRKRNDREKFRTDDNSDKQRTEHTPRCGYVDHIIAKFPKPPKDNKKQ